MLRRYERFQLSSKQKAAREIPGGLLLHCSVSRLQPDDHALQVTRVVGRALGAVGADDDGVGMAETANPRSVDARLNGEHHIFLDHIVAALVDEGPFMPFQ